MEDTYVIVQDLMIDECLKASLYAVLDGHGGDSCAHFIRKRLANEVRTQLLDPTLGIRRHPFSNINQCITLALKRAF